MSKYLVKLKPANAFFFGGECVFGFENEQNNIVKSRKLPQQTSILGMIRKEILIKENQFKIDFDYNENDKKKNDKLIGSKSFTLYKIEKDKKSKQKFGVIKRISPIFLTEEIGNKDKIYIQIPKDHKKSKEIHKYEALNINSGNNDCLKVRANFAEEVFLPTDFDGKNGISDDFLDIESKRVLKEAEVFSKDCSIGIKLDENHKTDDNSLFRLEKYRLLDNKQFSFILELDDKVDFNNYKNIVSLGGEGSYFFMSAKKIDYDYDFESKIKEIIKIETEKYKKIVLLSDTYISKEIYEKNCIYSISKKINFRNLITKDKKFEKSEKKHFFLERGSVLFTNNEKKYEYLKKHIKNEDLQQIGYNIFI